MAATVIKGPKANYNTFCYGPLATVHAISNLAQNTITTLVPTSASLRFTQNSTFSSHSAGVFTVPATGCYDIRAVLKTETVDEDGLIEMCIVFADAENALYDTAYGTITSKKLRDANSDGFVYLNGIAAKYLAAGSTFKLTVYQTGATAKDCALTNLFVTMYTE